MGDQAVTSLYRKVVSPSVRFKTEGLQKESHARHVQYRGRSPHTMRHLAASPSIFFTQPSRSAYSAPSRVENRQTVFKGSDNQITAQENRANQNGNYDFHPTTRFKTTSLPAMPMTSRYAQSVNGVSRSVPLSTTRHSALSLPDKLQTSDINPRILFTSQKQRQLAESKAKDECRRLKRKSEIIAHRVDKHYYLCGSKIPVKNRWDVDANDLMRLKLLAHQKQLGQYQAIKGSQADLCDPRDSPSGQLSSPTPYSGKENSADLSSGQQSPRESEGKWAEDTKSETSSIDDIDQILAMKGRRIRPPGSLANQQTTDTPDGNETVDKELAEQEEKPCVEDENTEQETSVADNDSADKVKDNNTVEEEKEKKNTKPTSKITKKIKNIRFQDEIKKPSNQRRVKSGNPKDDNDQPKEDKQKNDDHVNPYMDEWLGVKKKEVDERYKPGKPPPNRIFISSEISKSKVAQVAKFSDVFLTETITLHENQMNQNTDDLTPETMYGIIGEKQRGAFKAMFNEVDKDKNGSVTLEELKLKMMPAVSRDDIKNFVQVFDLNKDQTVDCREFTAICCLNDRLAGTRTETADGSIALDLEKLAQHIVIFKEMYKTMDEDDDNRLDCDEVLVMVSAAMGTETGTDLADARRVLSAARDEFGYIDFVGFMSYIPFFAKLLQAIMKNPLSINEIEKARERVKQRELTFKPKKITKKEPKSWEAY